MFSKSLLILAAVSSSCYAQQAAADVASSLDSFTQSLSDLETLVKAVSTLEQQEPVVNNYRDFMTAENNYVNANKQASPTAFTATEQEQICSSLITSADQHTSLLEALSSQRDAFDPSHAPVISALFSSDEKLWDSISFQIIGMTPTCQETTKESLGNLIDKFSEAKEKYQN